MEVLQTWPNLAEADLPQVAATVLARLASQNDATAQATVLGLEGNLGAGKTTFTKACAAKLGVTEAVTSPTFVIMKQYETTHQTFTRLVHIDAYRLEEEAELTVLGWDTLLQTPQTLILLEWPSQVAGVLPAHSHRLNFVVAGENRDITFTYGH